MFGVSWTELLVVALGALVVLGPKDMIIMAGKAGAWMRSLHMHWHDIKTHFHKTMDESGVFHDVKDFYRDVTPQAPRRPAPRDPVLPVDPQNPTPHGPDV
jgi:Sec-independent protein translocase protein TatA